MLASVTQDDASSRPPRIQPAPATDNRSDVQELLDQAGALTGDAANIFRTLARNPGVFRKWMPFGGKLLLGSKLPARERELLILATAWECGSEYEWGQHIRIGRDAGLSDQEMARIAQGRSAAGWNDQDQVLLDAAASLCRDHTLADDTWASLAERFDEQQLIEVTLLVGHYAMLAGFLNSARVKLDPGLDRFPTDQPAGDPHP